MRLTAPQGVVIAALIDLLGVVLTEFGSEILECCPKPPQACGSDKLLGSIGNPSRLGEGAILHHKDLTGPNNYTSVIVPGTSVVISGTKYSAKTATLNVTFDTDVKPVSEIVISTTRRVDFSDRYLLVTIKSIDEDRVKVGREPQWIKIDAIVCETKT